MSEDEVLGIMSLFLIERELLFRISLPMNLHDRRSHDEQNQDSHEEQNPSQTLSLTTTSTATSTTPTPFPKLHPALRYPVSPTPYPVSQRPDLRNLKTKSFCQQNIHELEVSGTR
jgi:hypothetical protein